MNAWSSNDPNVAAILRQHRTSADRRRAIQGMHLCASDAAVAAQAAASTRLINEWRPNRQLDPGHDGVPRKIRRRFRSARSSPTAMYQFTLQSPTRTSSTSTRRSSKQACARCRDLRGVNSDLQIKNPQVNVDIDRDKAHRARASRAQHDRRRSRTTPTARARSRPSTRRTTNTG